MSNIHSESAWATALENCASEPIHLPGTVQPYGALLAIDSRDWSVTHASANIGGILGGEVSQLRGGLAVEALFGAGNVDALRRAHDLYASGMRFPVHERIELAAGAFDMSVHQHDGRIILEVEPASSDALADGMTIEQLPQALDLLNGNFDVKTLCDRAPALVRNLSGLDRIMIYRFDEDWNGEVVAESRRDDLEPFLGLHYPASDIPPQARRLYQTNLARYIPDVLYQPVTIRALAAHATDAPLDLSYANLRGISPVHLEYLRNMGVRATFTLSLMVEGKLWGLIACHHYTPASISYTQRKMVGIVAQSLSALIGQAARTSEAEQNLAGSMLHERVLAATRTSRYESFASLIGTFGREICGVAGCAAIIVWSDETRVAVPNRVDDAELDALVNHCKQRLASATNYESSRLGEEFSGSTQFGGILAARSAKFGNTGFALLREAYENEILWAGNPEKAVSILAGGLKVSPRQSFATWVQLVSGHAIVWTEPNLEFMRKLAGAQQQLELRLAEEAARRLNAAHEEKIAQLAEFDYTIAHDLRSPLRALIGFASILREPAESDDAATRDRLLQRIVSNAEFMNRLLNDLLRFARTARVELSREPVSNQAIVAECVALLLDQRPHVRFEVSDLPDCEADPGLLKQVWFNLLDNAAKYASKKLSPTVRIDFTDGCYRVSDNGVGFEQKYIDKVFGVFTRLHTAEQFEGSGIGMAIVKRIVERHGGTIDGEGRRGEGATFRFSIGLPQKSAPLQS